MFSNRGYNDYLNNASCFVYSPAPEYSWWNENVLWICWWWAWHTLYWETRWLTFYHIIITQSSNHNTEHPSVLWEWWDPATDGQILEMYSFQHQSAQQQQLLRITTWRTTLMGEESWKYTELVWEALNFTSKANYL